MSRSAVLLCGHGSRDGEAIGEFEEAAAALRARLDGRLFSAGYLEFARPTIGEGLAALRAQGARHILAIPGMLFAASHVKNDLPWEINSFAAAHPDVEVRLGGDLGIDPLLLAAAAERIAAAVPARGDADRGDTLLVVVGRGTNDPDANSNIAKLARMLWEGMGFGWAEAAFSGVAHPRVDAALERAVRLGFRRIVVFPYFLFTGVLVKRIYDQTDAVAARFPDVEFVKASYLGDHAMVIDAFLDRIAACEAGEARMNCQLCKYRTRIVGYEAAAGMPQQGHHHHVRGGGHSHDPHQHELHHRHDLHHQDE